MTTEQHEKADKLQVEIKNLKEHHDQIKYLGCKPSNGERVPHKYRLSFRYDGDRLTDCLDTILPIHLNDFISIYLMRIERRIAELQDAYDKI